jgi:5-dehydro-2-deoxygluconokinase
MDLDLRPTEWSALADYGRTLREVLPLVDVLIGTEEEYYAALASDPSAVIWGETLGEPERHQLESLVDGLVADSVVETIIIKRGAHGATMVSTGERSDVPGFAVGSVNTVGAGDAFAAGLMRSRLIGRDWYESVRYANACGAIQVTRHGCSAAFPTEAEVTAFLEKHGGT